MPRDNFTMSENSGSFGMQQRQDRFDAIGDLIVGPPGPPGPQGPPGADGTVSFDELTPAQKESLRGEGVPAGGTTGQVLAKASNTDYDTEWVNQSGGSASMTILSYGNSTWADFIAAYNSNSIVYCRASSAADPSSGSQTRLAFMAYVNNASSPTSVEFQYYRSVSSHSDAQQGDQVYIYKLTSAGTWTVTVREAYTKIAAGTNMTSSYANGTLTLNATGGGTEDALPLAGGTMTGDIDMDGNRITNLPTPTNYLDAANKNYVDKRYIKPASGIPQTDLASAVQTSLGKADTALQAVPSTYRTAAAQDAIDAAQDSNLATIESSPATAAHAVGDYIVYNGQLYKVTAAISPGETLTPGTNTAATNASESFLPKGRMIDITNQCQIGTGTIGYVKYYQTDSIIVLAVQVFNINFTGVNVWLRLPDSFPGDANVFTALATGFDGMVCVFRTQSGNGKYLLIQSTQQGSYNLTGTGICFA